MSVLCISCVSSSTLSADEISHAPVPVYLPRDRVLFLFLPLAWFPIASLHYVFHYITPRLVFFRFLALSNAPCLRRE